MMDEKSGRLLPGNELAPRAPIRRFDVFAEYNRIKNEMKGMPPDQARGYAIWLAKIVAARKFARSSETRAESSMALGRGPREERADDRYPTLDGEAQTGAVFDREIVDRMGKDFYRQVFSPAVFQAVERKEPYQAIRDRLRVPWNISRTVA